MTATRPFPLAPPPNPVVSTAPAPVRFVATDVPALPIATPDASNTQSQSFFDSLRAVTPALIVTGIAIGIASGIGSTVGSAIGASITERFQKHLAPRSARPARSRSRSRT